jgi:hypothetical protein
VEFAKVFRIFKKGSKSAARRSGQKKTGGFEWPSGLRIGVFGHSNVGKTVFFTVLNEECKVARDIQLSVTDNATAAEFLRNFRAIWGLGTTSEVGTVVDLYGEKKFPDPSRKDMVLQFNAILQGGTNLPVVSLDYPGSAVSISEPSELKDKITDFMTGCHGLLFFFDPKVLGAELETQSHVAAFVNMIERLAPLGVRLPIPIGLVITKADILDGFAGDDQVVLISADDENLLAESFEAFLERTLASGRVSSSPTWSASVRSVLTRLREFLKVVVGRTLDFQVFFISFTGSQPEKIGTDVGRSVYRPPERMSPIGVKEPFAWLVRSIVRNRRISRLRKVAKFVATLSIIWTVLYSLPFLFHFGYLLPKATRVEDNILEASQGNMYNTTSQERSRIVSEYGRYERSWTTKYLFPRFTAPAGRIRVKYSEFDLSEEIKRLDQVIGRFTSIVQDSSLWPKLNPSDTILIENEEHRKLALDLDQYHHGDSTTLLYKRSDRMIRYWNMFRNFIRHPGESDFYNTITEQVQFDTRTLANELSTPETALGQALTSNLRVRAARQVQKQVAQQAATEVSEIFERIDSNPDPIYRFGDAVTELRRLQRQLDPQMDAEALASVQRYLTAVEKYDQKRKYTYKVEAVPGQGHLHMEVTGDGKDPTWSEQSQIIEGFSYSLQWKAGDDIHLALDTLGAAEYWGKTASDKKILKEQYALLEMEGEVSFDNLRQKVSIRFSQNPVDDLPKLSE